MFSNSNRWVLSISTVAITVVGSFSPLNSPVVAQTAQCSPRTPQGGSALPGNVPRDVRVQAQAAANALPNVPNVQLTRFGSEVENGVRIWELNGRRGDNGCLLEIDAISTSPSSDTSARVEETELQLPIVSQSTLPQLPAAVRNRLRAEGFTAARFRVAFIEQSRRFTPPRPVPPVNQNAIVYEIEGTCTANISRYCTAGTTGEADISADGTTFVFTPSS